MFLVPFSKQALNNGIEDVQEEAISQKIAN